MKKVKPIKPGLIDGRRGSRVVRYTKNRCVWHTHYNDDGRRVGLELVSGKEHWWQDTKIKWPNLRQGDWNFLPLKDSVHEWQLPWAWQYECLREWQPWSDFERWRNDWRKEVKRLRSRSAPRFQLYRKGTREKTESDAAFSYGGLLKLWLLRDFAEFFPQVPWVNIPAEKRNALRNLRAPGSHPISLEGSLLDLKEGAPEATGSPFDGEYLDRYRQWLEDPGLYRNQDVREVGPGDFIGTYVIHIPWYYTDDDLKAGFTAWLKKKERDLGTEGCRKKFSRTGWDKRYADFKQLGALRLLRKKTAIAAIKTTQKFLKDKHGKPCSLFGEDPTAWYRARRSADRNLQRFLGVT